MRRGSGTYVLLGWLAFAGPLALFVASLAPGVAFWDTGEMQTVPYILGIAHPTGFPVFVLLGWLFSHLALAGSIAWRLSLMSALAAAGAAWLVFAAVVELTDDGVAAGAAAILFATGEVLWTRATHAEVHDLALFFGALAIAAAIRAGRRDSRAAAFVAALALGLGLATHPVVVFALPCVALALTPYLRGAGPGAARRLGFVALAPLLLYLYVPLRSAYVEAHTLDPTMVLGIRGGSFWNYGAPSTPRAFMVYVTGSDFRPAAAFGAAATPPGLLRAIAAFDRDLYLQYGVIAVALAFAGAVALGASEPLLLAGLAFVVLGDVLFGGNFRAESDPARYDLLAFWALAVAAGVGAARLCRALLLRDCEGALDPPLRVSLTAGALLLAGLFPGALDTVRQQAALRSFEDARALGPDVRRSTPDGAIVVAQWNFATPLAYEAYVERALGRRLVVSGWPGDYADRYPEWRKRGPIYVVLSRSYDLSGIARPVSRGGRYQIAELLP
jgi:hypothetical protein